MLKKRGRLAIVFLVLGSLLVLCLVFGGRNKPVSLSTGSSRPSSQSGGAQMLAKADDWELILVNRKHMTKELNPELAWVENVQVDARIKSNVESFLAAARRIDEKEHLISGYRSVSYQEGLFNSYVEQEQLDHPSWTYDQAVKKVQTYSQPPGASEHQTGLAIDISTVDSLNSSDPATVERLRKIAPKYGFVLRFDKSKSEITGVGYEDWHFRYVGKDSAEYMEKHKLSLEEYVEQLS